MNDTRIEVFNRVKVILEKHPDTVIVQLDGSLAEGTADPYSNIDIRWTVAPGQNAKAFQQLPHLLYQLGPVLFTPVFGHIPNRWVMNVWPQALVESNIFWWVDIEVHSDPHCKDLKVIHREPQSIDHILRIWAQALKYHFRGRDDVTIRLEKLIQVLGMQCTEFPSSHHISLLREALNIIKKHESGGQKQLYSLTGQYLSSCTELLQDLFSFEDRN